MALQQLDLLLGQNMGLLLSLAFETQKTLMPRTGIVAKPDASHARRAHAHPLEPELVGQLKQRKLAAGTLSEGGPATVVWILRGARFSLHLCRETTAGEQRGLLRAGTLFADRGANG